MKSEPIKNLKFLKSIFKETPLLSANYLSVICNKSFIGDAKTKINNVFSDCYRRPEGGF